MLAALPILGGFLALAYTFVLASRTLSAEQRARERAFAFQLPPRRRLPSHAVEFRPPANANAEDRLRTPNPMWDRWLDG